MLKNYNKLMSKLKILRGNDVENVEDEICILRTKA